MPPSAGGAVDALAGMVKAAHVTKTTRKSNRLVIDPSFKLESMRVTLRWFGGRLEAAKISISTVSATCNNRP
jgi:hypothetical protein